AVRRQFGPLAADPRKFHDTMQSIFGDSHDQKQAEAFRQRALKGDHGWLPPVKWVSANTLQGGNGAYDKSSGTVLISEALRHNPGLAGATFAEEAGHHLDAKLN